MYTNVGNSLEILTFGCKVDGWEKYSFTDWHSYSNATNIIVNFFFLTGEKISVSNFKVEMMNSPF